MKGQSLTNTIHEASHYLILCVTLPAIYVIRMGHLLNISLQ